ncbi:MAG: hypothetical protein ACI4KH_08045 [Oscillospiraceae bacterium]
MKKIVAAVLVFSLLLAGCNMNGADTPAETTNETTETTTVPETIAQTEQVTERTVEKLDFPDIRNLKWGMSVEEVKAHEEGEFFKETVEDSGFSGQIQTLITYRNIKIDGYTAKMVLCVTDGIGLDGVNYHIPGDKYDEIYEKTTALYGKPQCDFDEPSPCATWIIPEKGYKIFLLSLNSNTTTQYSFYPLTDDEKQMEINREPAPEETTTEQKVDWDAVKPDVRNVCWGMNVDEVKERETETLSYEYEKRLLVYENVTIMGKKADLIYYFNDEGKLFQIVYVIDETGCDENSIMESYYFVNGVFIDLYGQPNEVWRFSDKDADKTEAEKNPGAWVISGRLAITSGWNIDERTFTGHWISKDQNNINHIVSYGSSKYFDELNQAQNEQQQQTKA